MATLLWLPWWRSATSATTFSWSSAITAREIFTGSDAAAFSWSTAIAAREVYRLSGGEAYAWSTTSAGAEVFRLSGGPTFPFGDAESGTEIFRGSSDTAFRFIPAADVHVENPRSTGGNGRMRRRESIYQQPPAVAALGGDVAFAFGTAAAAIHIQQIIAAGAVAFAITVAGAATCDLEELLAAEDEELATGQLVA